MLLKNNSAALILNESTDIDEVVKPVKNVEAIAKSGTKSEPSPVSKSVVSVIDFPVATNIVVMVVIAIRCVQVCCMTITNASSIFCPYCVIELFSVNESL